MSRKQTVNQPIPGFNPRDYVRPGLSESDIIEIKGYFDFFDRKQAGSITSKQLKDALLSLGEEARSKDIYQVILDLDSQGNGRISFDQFLHLMTPRLLKNDSRENVNLIFSLFDTHKTGFISAKDLRIAVRNLHLNLTEQDIELMISVADTDNDGYVSSEDFFKLFSQFKLGQP